MPNPYFSFKQFTVFQDRCAMKVGIDGVLLGAWAPVENTNHILDIGTGTGLIALMLAQRSSSLIDAIDIDSSAVAQAAGNIKLSPWATRINVQEMSLQDFAATTTQRYDLIVSNPPYFVNSLKAPSIHRTIARHTDSLTHEELIVNALHLLKPTGRICLILPVNEALDCEKFALNNGLFCTSEVKVIPKPNADVKRMLLEFSLQSYQKEISELVIESNERHRYSEEFSLLAKEFYLKL
ncbi:MAG: methyltransferase [Bacteroidota bacterium]|nr:methyltransferase [Bacteroidota bacterium]